MLSGNSLRNKDWIEHAQIELANAFDETYVQDYAHWHSGHDWIDLEHELDILGEAVADIESPYGVFAKSIGCVLALQAIDQDILKPAFIFLLGIPLDYIIKDYPQFKDILGNQDCPIGIIHNKNDKVGTSAAVADYLGEDLVEDIRWQTPSGDTHDYEDYELLRGELDALIRISQDH